MRERVTNEHLREMVDDLNRCHGRITDPMTTGSFVLDSSNGGLKLERVVDDFGGVVSLSERMTKREMKVFLGAALAVHSEKWRG